MNNYADEIKSRVTMGALAERIGLRVNRNGFACCPLHGEKTASMRVYPGNRGFCCYGCHRAGSVIDFAMEYFGLTYGQAVDKLDEDFALGLKRPQSAAEKELARRAALAAKAEREAWQRAVEAAEDDYWMWFRLYQMLDRVAADNRPKRPTDAINEAYAGALRLLPEVRDAYERAADACKILKSARNGGDHVGAGAKAGGHHQPVEQGRLFAGRRAV